MVDPLQTVTSIASRYTLQRKFKLFIVFKTQSCPSKAFSRKLRRSLGWCLCNVKIIHTKKKQTSKLAGQCCMQRFHCFADFYNKTEQFSKTSAACGDSLTQPSHLCIYLLIWQSENLLTSTRAEHDPRTPVHSHGSSRTRGAREERGLPCLGNVEQVRLPTPLQGSD